MKKTFIKVCSFMGMFALTISTLVANRACVFYFNQPELPKQVKSLRKF